MQNFQTGSMRNGKTYPLFANNWITSVKLPLHFLEKNPPKLQIKVNKRKKKGGGVVVSD